MESMFMGIVSLYFLVKGIYFIIAKVDKLENFVDEWDWISGKDK